ncbi:hypothetical protein [Geothrix sp. PMB-07]|uniref:hypothetical protein n=1 Tax=Geothrix sp. PMB-07 TaxID=3068640 RepID=UPI002740B1E6|nr:hypothetical protein [Geothrix sp. PMB-07]WLT33351.1 hypothetical protein Q9293_08430 [Geothrix sp. PMB-07]
MLTSADFPYGQPSLDLGEDEIFTVAKLIVDAARVVRPSVPPGDYEVPINIRMRKALRKVKRDIGLNNIEIHGEDEVLNEAIDDPEVEGRIDIVVRFLQQFGDENAYLGIECKRLLRGDSGLNINYVDKGLARFVTCQYSCGHKWGMMVGYVMNPPLGDITEYLNSKICERYGPSAAMENVESSELVDALDFKKSKHTQIRAANDINILHIIVPMGN